MMKLAEAVGKDGLSPPTILQVHHVLRNALKQAMRWNIPARNSCDMIDPPSAAKHEMRALEAVEVGQLLDAARGGPMRVAVLVAISTGLRRGKLLAIKWGEIDGDQLRVQRALEQVQQRLMLGKGYKDQGWILTSVGSPGSFSGYWQRLIKRSKMARVRFHYLRHTHASQRLKSGVHVKVVSERLGHARIALTLDIYSHLLEGMEATEIDTGVRWIRAVRARDGGLVVP